jgi:hypothetical protein
MDNDCIWIIRLALPAMKRCLTFSLLLLCLLGTAGGASAQGYWRDMPPDERRQMRQQMREHWQQEREIRREEGGSRWRDMPQEDRRRLRDELREQRAWPDRHDERGGRGRGGRRD